MLRPPSRPLSAIAAFLKQEAAGGILLIVAGAAAMAVANSPLSESYFHALHAMIGPLSVHAWINDALMAAFFLLVGLEIKREFSDGQLAAWSDRTLPFIAAAAGMIVPAIIYLVLTRDVPGLMRGWAIPSATDIAFAIGVLALLGPRVPISLKLLLTTVAIVDDMGAVAIIALVYTPGLKLIALGAAGLIFGAMLLLARFGVRRLWPYLLLAPLLWLAIFQSGVHATIAGVLAAFAIPVGPDPATSPLHRLEHRLHPYVAFAIVPLFGFANAGVALAGVGLKELLSPLPIGVAMGLFIGKQLGIFGSIRLAVACGIAQRPAGASWTQTYGVAMICGIGFTMSLFIGGLAFADPLLGDEMKIGVLGGSLLSAVCGYAVLRFAGRTEGSVTPIGAKIRVDGV
jgi:NhaA family Na+:H+ antiporter